MVISKILYSALKFCATYLEPKTDERKRLVYSPRSPHVPLFCESILTISLPFLLWELNLLADQLGLILTWGCISDKGFTTNTSMSILRPSQPLFSQALCYCRINNELKEKCIITQDLARMERCYFWKGDAEKTNTEESPTLPVPEQLYSIIPMRTCSWETHPMSWGGTLIPSSVLLSGGKYRFHSMQNSLWTIYHQQCKVYFENCWPRVQIKRRKIRHGFRQTAQPTFLVGKETNYVFWGTLLAHQRGTHRINWIFKLASFFITRPKQIK